MILIAFENKINLNEYSITYRPCELERESDGISKTGQGDIWTKINDVLAEDRCNNISVSTRCRCVDLHLVLLQTYPKPGLANT